MKVDARLDANSGVYFIIRAETVLDRNMLNEFVRDHGRRWTLLNSGTFSCDAKAYTSVNIYWQEWPTPARLAWINYQRAWHRSPQMRLVRWIRVLLYRSVS